MFASDEVDMSAAEVAYVLGVDIGTTSVKVTLVETTSKSVSVSHSQATNAAVPGTSPPSSNEQDVRRIRDALHACISRLPCQQLRRVVSIGVCGQMHGVVLWRRRDAGDAIDSASNLVTWQDSRCDADFLATLPAPDSHLQLSTGHGVATLFWLRRHRPKLLAQYDRAGTVMDLVVADLCGLDRAVMSVQNAASWGYVDTEAGCWNLDKLSSSGFPVDLLPVIVSTGSYAGKLTSSWFEIPKGTPVGVASGDMQCSFVATFQTEGDAVLNISTSAQLSFIMPEGFSPQMSPSNSPIQFFPYFDGQYLAVAASLNGGNVLACFVNVLQQWTRDLGLEVPEDKVWETILSTANRDSADSDLVIVPTLFGERHLSTQRASALNIDPYNTSLGAVTRSICKGILSNISSMMPNEKLAEAGIRRVVGTGSALLRNSILQEELKKEFHLPVAIKSDSDAAFGAALAMLLFSYKNI